MSAPFYCSFCGKSQHEVFRLIAAPSNVFICDECVDGCALIIQHQRFEEAGKKEAEVSDGPERAAPAREASATARPERPERSEEQPRRSS